MFGGMAFSGALRYGQQAGDGDAAATLGWIWPSPVRPRSMPPRASLAARFLPLTAAVPSPQKEEDAITTSFNKVAPSSPLRLGRIPFSPIAYVIRFGLPPAAAGGPDPSSPPS
jgi:hypothetical protein